jgi:hypothetical protein
MRCHLSFALIEEVRFAADSPVEEGVYCEPDRFRGLLVDAELPDVAAQVQNAELRNAAQQIRSIKAAAGHIETAG